MTSCYWREKKMAIVVFVALLGLLLAHGGQCSNVNSKCRTRLTSVDRHMDKYVGKTYTLEGKHADDTVYMYEVGICVDLDDNCAVLQKGATLNSDVCVGNINNSQVARSHDGMWIELVYTGGHFYGSHCKQQSRTARIVFLCDPDISGMGKLEFLEENNKDELCYYLFALASSAVCGFSYSQSTLSVGDILLIIGAVVVVLWMVAMATGVLYKRFVMGAKGWEQVPLLDFYREFGNLEADGCDLVCRSRRHKVTQYHEPTFGADTDDSEEEKDDNLLPM